MPPRTNNAFGEGCFRDLINHCPLPTITCKDCLNSATGLVLEIGFGPRTAKSKYCINHVNDFCKLSLVPPKCLWSPNHGWPFLGPGPQDIVNGTNILSTLPWDFCSLKVLLNLRNLQHNSWTLVLTCRPLPLNNVKKNCTIGTEGSSGGGDVV